jgi:CheY-like chemotaxis protein
MTTRLVIGEIQGTDMTLPTLAGLRVLIVDDEPLIADFLQSLLEDAGCSVVGFAGTVETALAAVGQGALDGVLLDVSLHGQSSAPVAEMLQTNGVPFVVLTGHIEAEFANDALNNAPRLTKPFEVEHFQKVVAATLAARTPHLESNLLIPPTTCSGV